MNEGAEGSDEGTIGAKAGEGVGTAGEDVGRGVGAEVAGVGASWGTTRGPRARVLARALVWVPGVPWQGLALVKERARAPKAP